MATENLKSTQVTALDAFPVTNGGNVAGKGAPAPLMSIDGTGVTAVTGKTTGSTYQMCRIPSNCKVKNVRVALDVAVTTFTCDIGLYYSTSHIDGTKQSNVADVVSGTTAPTVLDADFFGSAVALAAIVSLTEYSQEAGTYTAAKHVQPIWQAAGLSADPGGFFDVTLTNTATNSGGPVPYMQVVYTY